MDRRTSRIEPTDAGDVEMETTEHILMRSGKEKNAGRSNLGTGFNRLSGGRQFPKSPLED